MNGHKLFALFLSLSALLFLLAGCVSEDAKYIRRDINTLQMQIDALREDIKNAQRTLSPPEPTVGLEARKEQADLQAELDGIRRDLESLKATIEDGQQVAIRTSERLDDQEARFTARLNDLEERFGQLPVKGEETKETPSTPVQPSPTAEAAVTPEIQEGAAPPGDIPPPAEGVYREAYETFQSGDLDGAKKKFLAFLKEYPDTPLSDNAQFWIGEIAFKKHQYESAILAYENVIKKYPDSNKLPDAILKQGLAFLELGDKIDAKIILENLVKKYPSTEQAKIAKKTLQSL